MQNGKLFLSQSKIDYIGKRLVSNDCIVELPYFKQIPEGGKKPIYQIFFSTPPYIKEINANDYGEAVLFLLIIQFSAQLATACTVVETNRREKIEQSLVLKMWVNLGMPARLIAEALYYALLQTEQKLCEHNVRVCLYGSDQKKLDEIMTFLSPNVQKEHFISNPGLTVPHFSALNSSSSSTTTSSSTSLVSSNDSTGSKESTLVIVEHGGDTVTEGKLLQITKEPSDTSSNAL